MISIFRGRRWRLYIVILALLSGVSTLLFSLQGPADTPAGFNFELSAQNDPPPDPDAYPYGALVIAAQNDTDLAWTDIPAAKYV